MLKRHRVSVVMRRPNLLRTNGWISDCVEFLITHGSISALDNTIVAWVKLLQLTEEIVAAFSLDDSSNIANCEFSYPHNSLR